MIHAYNICLQYIIIIIYIYTWYILGNAYDIILQFIKYAYNVHNKHNDMPKNIHMIRIMIICIIYAYIMPNNMHIIIVIYAY